jgi:outer membrane protein
MPSHTCFAPCLRLAALAILLGCAPAVASAQDTPPAAATTDGVVAQDVVNPQSAPLPPAAANRQKRAVDLLSSDRVGVEKGKSLSLSLHDAILMALRNNQDIEIERTNVQQAQFTLNGAFGVYDRVFGNTFQFSNSTSPTAQTFLGAQGGSFQQKNLTFTPSLTQTLTTGGNYSVTFNSDRATNNAGSAGLSPQFRTSLEARFTQPLFRNFRSSQNERLVKINRKQLNISDSQFRQRVINTIASVQSAYWDLVFAIRNNQIQRDAVELADVSLAITQRQVEVGTTAPIEVVSTQSELENRKDLAISALQQVTTAENALKALIFGDPSSDMWTAAIEPTERVDFTPVNFDLKAAMDNAVKNRPELEQLHLQQEVNEIEKKFARNQMLPQVDFVTSYSLAGLSGQPPTTTPGAPNLIAPRFIGGFGTSLKNLFQLDFPTYTFGVNFSFTFKNRAAKANIGRAIATERQLKARDRQLQQTVQVEVRNALQAVASARQRVEAARAARVAAETQLKGEEQRYAAGLSTNFLLLDRQNRLSVARGNEIRALTDYNKAIGEVQRVIGTTLSANGIQITEDDSHVDPSVINNPMTMSAP